LAAAAARDRRLLAAVLQATVPRMASPIELPTCCPTLIRLDATLVSSLRTLVSRPTRLRWLPAWARLLSGGVSSRHIAGD
jgi:hypothetical protein